MTDTPRRRPPLPTKSGTLSIKPRTTAPAEPAPASTAKPDREWRKPADGTPNRKRGKASFPEQANAEPERGGCRLAVAAGWFAPVYSTAIDVPANRLA